MLDKNVFILALEKIPDGASRRRWRDQIYITTKQTLQNGKLIKLYAEGLAKNDHISFNLYRLAKGDDLHPCEMPEEKAVDFVLNSRAAG